MCPLAILINAVAASTGFPYDKMYLGDSLGQQRVVEIIRCFKMGRLENLSCYNGLICRKINLLSKLILYEWLRI